MDRHRLKTATNSDHNMIMKLLKLYGALLCGALIASALPQTCSALTFKTLSAGGNSTVGAWVAFPPDATMQLTRIVGVNWQSDNATAALSFRGGSTALWQVATNAATTSVTNLINSTNGLAVGSFVLLVHNGTCYSNTVVSWNSSTNFTALTTNSPAYGGTNVVLTTGGWGVATSIGDEIFVMDTAVTIPIGATTNYMGGDAIYVANLPNRPVWVQLSPATTTNRLNSVTARMESQ